MTPEERQLLTALSDRIRQTPAQDRDPEAERMIGQLVQARPDTPYVLAQTVIMQDFALRNAQSQIAELQRQLQEARSAPPPRQGGSFLGNLFGTQPAPAPSVPPSGPWGQAAYAPPPPQPAYPPAYQPVMMQPSQTSGFLRQAATTAAGIAGGALLFEGIQSLFSGHAGYGGFGPGYGGGPALWGGEGFAPRESLSETTIINNYGDTNVTEPAPERRDAGYQPDANTGDQGYDQGDSGYQDASDQDFSGGSDDLGGDSDYT